MRGVLFDVDGTLVDTTYLHTVAWWEALNAAGHPVEMVRIHRSIGMGSDKILDYLVGRDRDRAGDARLREDHATRYRRYWPDLHPLPGAVPVLRECHRRGLQVVLASSAAEDELKALRAALDCDDVISAATSAEDADQSKPAPDILEAALSQSGLAPAEVVFVGDAVWDVEAAGRLDIPCVALTCGGTPAQDLREAGAVEVLAGPEELLGRLDAVLSGLA